LAGALLSAVFLPAQPPTPSPVGFEAHGAVEPETVTASD
jgi:hypothetical protein